MRDVTFISVLGEEEVVLRRACVNMDTHKKGKVR
jgi:hypothetical protein